MLMSILPPRRSTLRYVAALCVGALATIAHAQSTAVIPPAAESTAGNVGDQIPLGDIFGGSYQVIYAPSQLGSIPPGSVITGLQIRRNNALLASWPAAALTIGRFDISLGSSSRTPATATATFADNISAPVLVRSGPLQLAAGAYPGGPTGSVPKAFGPLIQFSTGYVYSGGPLVVLFRVQNAAALATNFADIFTLPGEIRDIGNTGDADATSGLLYPDTGVVLRLTFTPPPVSDQSTGEDLGVRELVISQFSYFYGSGPERVQNIQAAAARFHGLLVPPGATFSMAEALGDISLENGYAEALIISGGRTIQGVGGGVCQVSTTLFRTVFFGGYPVVERHPHAYRVSYYEKEEGNRRNPRLAGLDAAVFVPLVDFKFINNSSSWLLMETYVNPTYSNIQWKFYSTNDGRSVDWETTGPTNVKEAPKPSYKENPDLPTGEVKQVDYAADGAEIRVIRRVYKDGALFFEDSFYTEYQPWQAMYEYGPGTEGMPPEDTEEPAPE